MNRPEFPETLNNDRCKALFANVEKVKGGLFSTKLEITLNDCSGKEIYRTAVGASRAKAYKKAYSEALKKAFSSIEFLEYNYEPFAEKTSEESTTKVKIVEQKPKKETKTVTLKNPTKDDGNQVKDTTLYAQKQPYGYQVVDATPSVVMQLLSTTAKDVFLVRDKNAIVYKDDGFWYYSENNGELKAPKTLNIKF